MASFLYLTCLQEIKVVVFISLDWIFVRMSNPTMIPCRHMSEEIGHGFSQVDNIFTDRIWVSFFQENGEDIAQMNFTCFMFDMFSLGWLKILWGFTEDGWNFHKDITECCLIVPLSYSFFLYHLWDVNVY